MDNRNDFYMQNEKVDNNNNKNEDIYSKGNTGKALEHKKRAKRQSSELSKTVNTVYDASFFLGFQLDAVDTYRNLSESLPEYSRLTVHFSPEFYRFEEEGHVRIFKTYSPHNDEILTIKVSITCSTLHMESSYQMYCSLWCGSWGSGFVYSPSVLARDDT